MVSNFGLEVGKSVGEEMSEVDCIVIVLENIRKRELVESADFGWKLRFFIDFLLFNFLLRSKIFAISDIKASSFPGLSIAAVAPVRVDAGPHAFVVERIDLD